MNISKKLIYTLVSVIALQAAVPAHASVWSILASKYSAVTTTVQNMSTEAKRTMGVVAAGVAALTALLFGTCTWYIKNKKQAMAKEKRDAKKAQAEAKRETENKQLQACLTKLRNDVERLNGMRKADETARQQAIKKAQEWAHEVEPKDIKNVHSMVHFFLDNADYKEHADIPYKDYVKNMTQSEREAAFTILDTRKGELDMQPDTQRKLAQHNHETFAQLL